MLYSYYHETLKISEWKKRLFERWGFSHHRRRLSIELNRAFNRHQEMRTKYGKFTTNLNNVLQEKWKRAGKKGRKLQKILMNILTSVYNRKFSIKGKNLKLMLHKNCWYYEKRGEVGNERNWENLRFDFSIFSFKFLIFSISNY